MIGPAMSFERSPVVSILETSDGSTARTRLTETRQELASCLTMKPETLLRALRVPADHGTIVVRGRIIDVVSRARLRSPPDDAETLQADS